MTYPKKGSTSAATTIEIHAVILPILFRNGIHASAQQLEPR
ncbi:hypothetical protein [Nocardia sp. NBC_01377]